MSQIDDRLHEIGLSPVQAGAPVANYRSHKRAGNLLAISGQISGGTAFAGCIGKDLDAEAGYQAAKSAALALVAQISEATNGRIDHVAGIVQLRIFMVTTPDFTGHSRVADGASDVLTAVFGANGEHARTAIGVASLPAGAAVEIDALIELAS